MSRIKTLSGGSGGGELIQSRARYGRGGVTKDSLQQLGAHQRGCTEPYALNYNPQADTEDLSCEFFHFQIMVGQTYSDIQGYTDIFIPLVMRFGFAEPALDTLWDAEGSGGQTGNQCYPFTEDVYPHPCTVDMGWTDDHFHTYTGPYPNVPSPETLWTNDFTIPGGGGGLPYFHAGIGTEWTGAEWMWETWLNYSPADYGVEHIFRLHIHFSNPEYTYGEEIAEIRFDWLAENWDRLSPYIMSMRLTDAFDGVLGLDLQAEEIMQMPDQTLFVRKDMYGEVYHIKVVPKDPLHDPYRKGGFDPNPRMTMSENV
jgi:hypothetical protein